MKKLLVLFVLILPLVFAQIQMPQNLDYKPSLPYDVPIFKNPPANVLEEYELTKIWPKINQISFDDKKNFTLQAGNGLTFTKQNNGLLLQANLNDLNFSDINFTGSNLFIRTDGTSTTTAKIPFAQGLDILPYSDLNLEIGSAIKFSNYGTGDNQIYGNGAGLTIQSSSPSGLIVVAADNDSGQVVLGAHQVIMDPVQGGYFSPSDDANFYWYGLVGENAEHARFESGKFNFFRPIIETDDTNTNRLCFTDGTCMSTAASGLPIDFNKQYYSQLDANAVFAKKTDLNSFVPYQGATNDLNMGQNDVNARKFILKSVADGLSTTIVDSTSGSSKIITLPNQSTTIMGLGNYAQTVTGQLTINNSAVVTMSGAGGLNVSGQLTSGFLTAAAANIGQPATINLRSDGGLKFDDTGTNNFDWNFNIDSGDGNISLWDVKNGSKKIIVGKSVVFTKDLDNVFFNSKAVWFNPNNKIYVGNNSGINGTHQYLKDLTTTCYQDWNNGLVTQIRGVGC